MNLRSNKVLDVEGLKADWGITPEQVIDLLSLTGDTVDNIPGVPGIGVKTASSLLQEFGTIEGLMANLDKVSGAKRKENLKAHEETVKRGRQLVALETDLPLELDWEHLKATSPRTKELKALCIECGFHGFLERARPRREGARAGLGLCLYRGRHAREARGLRAGSQGATEVLLRHRDDRP